MLGSPQVTVRLVGQWGMLALTTAAAFLLNAQWRITRGEDPRGVLSGLVLAQFGILLLRQVSWRGFRAPEGAAKNAACLVFGVVLLFFSAMLFFSD